MSRSPLHYSDCLIWKSVLLVTFQILAAFVLPGFHVGASKINITVDDMSTDDFPTKIEYIPQDQWYVGQECPPGYCTDGRPNNSSAHSSSWHYAVDSDGPGGNEILAASKSIRITFIGTAIYLYCILPNHVPTFPNVHYRFTMDQDPAGEYVHNTTWTDDYLFNVPVFSNDTLENGTHVVQMNTVGGSGYNSTVLMFDYFVVTQSFADPDTPNDPANVNNKKKSANAGLIAGSVVGGLVAIMLLVLAFYLLLRRHGRKNEDKEQLGAPLRPASVPEVPPPVSQPSMADSSTLTWLHNDRPPAYGQGDGYDGSTITSATGASSHAEQQERRIAELEQMVQRLTASNPSMASGSNQANFPSDTREKPLPLPSDTTKQQRIESLQNEKMAIHNTLSGHGGQRKQV